MTPIAPFDARLVDQSDIGLVDQAGGAQGVSRPLAPELGVRQMPELLVDQGKQPIHGLGVAAAHLERRSVTCRLSPAIGRRGLIHEGEDPERDADPAGESTAPAKDAVEAEGSQRRSPGLSPGELLSVLDGRMSLFTGKGRVHQYEQVHDISHPETLTMRSPAH